MKIVTLGCIASILGAGSSHANCDNSSLNGVYPFTTSGFLMGIYDSSEVVHYLNPMQPFSVVGQYTFDGQGNFTRVDYGVANGIPSNNASTPVNAAGFRTGQVGTYTISDDCTGQLVVNANGAVVALQIVVVDFGLSVRGIVATEHVPGFPNPPDGTTCTSGCDEAVNVLVELKKDVYSRR
jgi:hypothetical protein